MNNSSALSLMARYLASLAYEGGSGESKSRDPRVGLYPFITISRQAGAGGHSLAGALIQAMQERGGEIFFGWQVVDRELYDLLLKDPKMKLTLDSFIKERYGSPLEDYLTGAMAGMTPAARVHYKTFEILCKLASLGKVILLGRGGAYVTRSYQQGVRVHLVASKKSRIRRFAKEMGISPEEALQRLEELDRQRALLYRRCFSRDINDPLLFDAVWNTDSVSFEDMAAALIELAERKHRRAACLPQPSLINE